MIESLALRIAEAIKRIEPDKTASVAVMKFSLEGILNTLVTSVCIIAVGLVTESVSTTLMGMLAFVILRFFSGGMHLHKALHCSLLSIVLLSAAPHVPLTDEWVFIISALSLALIMIFAPANIRGHARLPVKYFPLLKIVSALIVCINFGLVSSTIAVVHLFQALSTIEFRKEVTK